MGLLFCSPGGELPETNIQAKQPNFAPFPPYPGHLGGAAHCTIPWRRFTGSVLQPDRRAGAPFPDPMDGQEPVDHPHLHWRLHYGSVHL